MRCACAILSSVVCAAVQHYFPHYLIRDTTFGEKGIYIRSASLIEVRKCLLSFGAEPFLFQVAIQKFKDQDIEL